jgi:hypothetical protein
MSRFAFLLLATGCNSGVWERRRIEQPTPLEPYDIVWIWSGGQLEKWHAVVITPDSVFGIPYKISLRCDSCRRSMPRTQVDSIKVGYTGAHKGLARTSLEVAGAVGVVILLEMVVCAALGTRNGC